jgi:hypothetical protein
MLHIRREGTKDFACAHCGALYEITETPAHDTGSAACEVCDTIMMTWVDSAIPLFRPKQTVENAKRRYLRLGSISNCRLTHSTPPARAARFR